MKYWLLKSEPNEFSIDDLVKANQQKTFWGGIRNYQARNFIKNDMSKGDLAFFYHSSCKIPGIVGIVKITGTPLADPSQFEESSEYYDPKSTQNSPRWFGIEVQLKEKWANIITLQHLKTFSSLKDFRLLHKGNRLSIFPVLKSQWQMIIQEGLEYQKN